MLFPRDEGSLFNDVITRIFKGERGLKIKICGDFMENLMRSMWAMHTFVYPELKEPSPIDLKMEKSIGSDDLVYFVCGRISPEAEKILLKKLSIFYMSLAPSPDDSIVLSPEPIVTQYSDNEYQWMAFDYIKRANQPETEPIDGVEGSEKKPTRACADDFIADFLLEEALSESEILYSITE